MEKGADVQIQGILYPPNAAVTAKKVKIDAVVGAAAMARTNAKRVQRERGKDNLSQKQG